MKRRELLKHTALGSLATAFPACLKAAESLAVTPLRDNLHLISGAGCNVVVAVGPDSVLAVDGGSQEHAQQLLQEINGLGQGKPIATLFNTNWRPEHCGLNYLLGPAGSEIIAHENTRLWQNNDFYVEWEDRNYHPMPKEAQANITFYKDGALMLGKKKVDYGFISQFHSDGDIYVHFPDSNVLVVGDMMEVGTYPLLDYVTGGWIGGAQKCTDRLLEIADEDTLIIPSHGGVRNRMALEVQKKMLDQAYEKVADAYRNGRSLDQFMAAGPMAEYNGIYGDPALFVRLLYRGTWYHVPGRAIRGII